MANLGEKQGYYSTKKNLNSAEKNLSSAPSHSLLQAQEPGEKDSVCGLRQNNCKNQPTGFLLSL